LKRKVLSVLLVVLLALAACSPKPEPSIPDPILPDFGQWDFDLQAVHQDATGISTNTAFKLFSRETVSVDFINQALKIHPQVAYAISEDEDGSFTIQPEDLLEKDRIYRVELTDASDDYIYKWAFQTKKDLTISGTIPGRQATYVPVKTGIEVIFSHSGVENFSSVFSIEPQVNGSFTENGHAQIFVPDRLEPNTTYKVTIEAGAKVKNSDLALAEDYVFSFTTEGSGRDQLVYFNDVVSTYTTSQTHFVSAYLSRQAESYLYDVSVYAFDSSLSFLEDLKQVDAHYAYDSLYNDLPQQIPAYLDLVSTFETSPREVRYGYMQYYSFEMPEPLDPGYYLVAVSYEDKSYYTYLQINDLLVYSSLFEDEGFAWVLDSKDQQGVSNATVTIDETYTGKTREDGTAIMSYADDPSTYIHYGKVSAPGYQDFIIRYVKRFNPYYMDHGPANDHMAFPAIPNQYFKYLFTDRSTYLPTDTLHLYGYVKPKVGHSGNYTMSLYSTVNGTYLLDEKSVTPTNTGTFTDHFSWQDLTPGWYVIYLTDDEDVVLRHEFHINEYTKPVYKVTGAFDKTHILAGDTITYEVTSQFFEGGPVPEMTFDYYLNLGDQSSGRLTTAENGQASETFRPSLSTDSWRPVHAGMEIYNATAENYPITSYADFVFLPKDRMLELSHSNETIPELSIFAHTLEADNYRRDYDFTYEDLRGQPLDTQVSVNVTAVWYEQREIGQVYDYINKVNRKTYESIRRTEVLDDRVYSLTNGQLVLQMPYATDEEKYYEVTVSMEDGHGGKIVERTSFSYYRLPQSDPFANYHTLRTEGDQYQFKLQEEVAYYLDNSGRVETQPMDQLLVLYLQDGLLHHEIKDTLSGSFEFVETYIPNILLQGVYASGGVLHKTFSTQPISYDYSEREIHIDVTTDKTDYGPGDEVTLSVTTTDADGNPYPADVNISIVDEAYFNLYAQTADLMGNLYSSIHGSGILTDYVSSDSGDFGRFGADMAEMGGESADYYIRSEFKDTATFMTLSTDASGNGTVTFNLPDNLTAWRITYQGINDKMEGATGWFQINAKLPFHISTILSKYFLTGDVPSISLRVFGEEAVKDSTVDYRVVLEDASGNLIHDVDQSGLVGAYTNVSFGSLKKGRYTITVYGTDGTHTDALQQSFEVIDSSVSFNHKQYYDLSLNTQFKPVLSPAEITFFNQSESSFYNALLDLRYTSGVRVDQQLATLEARRFIQQHFDPELHEWATSLNPYQNVDGGIRLLPYSDSNSFVSMQVAMLNPDHFNKEALRLYFRRVVEHPASNLNSVVNGYAGLAYLNESVLLDIYELMETTDLNHQHTLVLALALESIGDQRLAHALYQEVLEETTTDDPNQPVTIFDSPGDNYVATGLLTVLAGRLKDFDTGDSLFDYLYENPSEYALVNMEMLAYLMDRNIMSTEAIQALSGSVTLSYKDTEKTFDVFGFETATLTVSKEDLADMTLLSLTSDMGAYVYALSGADDLAENRVTDYSLRKSYSVNDQLQTSFNQSDLIKVTLSPTIQGDRPHVYQITDFVPAGFRFIRGDHDTGWFEQQEQKIIFYYWHHDTSKPITYYMQAVLPGQYKADHTVITQMGETGLNYTEQELLEVR